MAFVAVAASFGCGPTAKPPGVRAPAPPADPCGAAAASIRAHRADVARRARVLGDDGWKVDAPLDVRCEPASVLVARRGTTATLEAIGAGNQPAFRIEAREIELVSKDAPWDLRGDGGRAIVVRVAECRAGCAVTSARAARGEEVVELTAGAWKSAAVRPRFPSSMRDDDGDGVPEFDTLLARFRVAECERPGCAPGDGLDVDVLGIEAFDGAKFADDLRVFTGLYRGRLAWAREEAKRMRALPSKPSVCPLEAIAIAASIDVYGRILGGVETEALAEADGAMFGFDTAACESARQTGPAVPWSGLRYAVGAVKIPRLARGSATSRLGDH